MGFAQFVHHSCFDEAVIISFNHFVTCNEDDADKMKD